MAEEQRVEDSGEQYWYCAKHGRVGWATLRDDPWNHHEFRRGVEYCLCIYINHYFDNTVRIMKHLAKFGTNMPSRLTYRVYDCEQAHIPSQLPGLLFSVHGDPYNSHLYAADEACDNRGPVLVRKHFQHLGLSKENYTCKFPITKCTLPCWMIIIVTSKLLLADFVFSLTAGTFWKQQMEGRILLGLPLLVI